jgi:hypothetical protein
VRNCWCRFTWLVLSGAALAACGDRDEADTRYGPAGPLRVYRQRLDPVIDAINAVERQVADRAVGSSGQATAANLAAVYQQVRPRLEQAVADLAQLVPPPALAGLQRDIEQALRLRLAAYAAVLEGYGLQEEQGVNPRSEALYAQAEKQLRAANELLALANEELHQVDVALGSGAGTNPLV